MLNWLQFSTTSYNPRLLQCALAATSSKGGVHFYTLRFGLALWLALVNITWWKKSVPALSLGLRKPLYTSALNPRILPANKHSLVFWMTRHMVQAPLVTPATLRQPLEAELSTWPAADHKHEWALLRWKELHTHMSHTMVKMRQLCKY